MLSWTLELSVPLTIWKYEASEHSIIIAVFYSKNLLMIAGRVDMIAGVFNDKSF